MVMTMGGGKPKKWRAYDRAPASGHDKVPGKNKMTKADLIEEVSRVIEVTRHDSKAVIETIFGSIVGSLRKGDGIEIRGVGSFHTRQRRARVGRNPKTGDRVQVPPKRIPYFKPSKELKDLVNSSAEVQVPMPTSAPPK